MELGDYEIITIVKFNKLFLSKLVSNKMSNIIEEKLQILNVACFYKFSNLFSLPSLYTATTNYIQRCFTMVIESQNYLELDYTCVSRILASSSLQIDSELEVFNAANRWLIYNIEERNKYAKNLLLAVRLHLLSDYTLNYMLNKSSSICDIDECVEILNKALEDRYNLYNNRYSTYYTYRCCSQKMFNIMLCGGLDKKSDKPTKKVVEFNVNNLETLNILPSMTKERYDSKAVCIKGEVYVFGGYDGDHNLIMSVDKYSFVTKTWNTVTDMYDEREYFSTCAFMDKVYVVGGNDENTTNSCLQFDTKENNWREVVGMKWERTYAACTVFTGKIVVSGGLDVNINALNTVESYNVIADSWVSMPSMIEARYWHNLVVAKNKLFAIGGYTINACEIFDNACKQFVNINSPELSLLYLKVFSLGSKIFILEDSSSVRRRRIIHRYDVEKDEWSQESQEATKHISDYSYAKIPFY